jgi:dihydrofolate reductase
MIGASMGRPEAQGRSQQIFDHGTSTVLWHITMSVDGFIAGPGEAMDWIFDYWDGENETAADVIANTGAIIMGRGTYEVEDRNRPGIYGGAWSGPYFVLTHSPPLEVPPWMQGTFIDEPIDAAVARAKDAGGGKSVGLLGASTARQCLERGLLDEIIIHLAPVLLGGGVRLFDVDDGLRTRLEPTHVKRSGALTDLRFRVSDRQPR